MARSSSSTWRKPSGYATAIRAKPPSDNYVAMPAHRKRFGARSVAATIFLLAFATLAFALFREDVLMIALGLLLAATSMELFRR